MAHWDQIANRQLIYTLIRIWLVRSLMNWQQNEKDARTPEVTSAKLCSSQGKYVRAKCESCYIACQIQQLVNMKHFPPKSWKCKRQKKTTSDVIRFDSDSLSNKRFSLFEFKKLWHFPTQVPFNLLFMSWVCSQRKQQCDLQCGPMSQCDHPKVLMDQPWPYNNTHQFMSLLIHMLLGYKKHN